MRTAQLEEACLLPSVFSGVIQTARATPGNDENAMYSDLLGC